MEYRDYMRSLIRAFLCLTCLHSTVFAGSPWDDFPKVLRPEKPGSISVYLERKETGNGYVVHLRNSDLNVRDSYPSSLLHYYNSAYHDGSTPPNTQGDILNPTLILGSGIASRLGFEFVPQHDGVRVELPDPEVLLSRLPPSYRERFYLSEGEVSDEEFLRGYAEGRIPISTRQSGGSTPTQFEFHNMIHDLNVHFSWQLLIRAPWLKYIQERTKLYLRFLDVLAERNPELSRAYHSIIWRQTVYDHRELEASNVRITAALLDGPHGRINNFLGLWNTYADIFARAPLNEMTEIRSEAEEIIKRLHSLIIGPLTPSAQQFPFFPEHTNTYELRYFFPALIFCSLIEDGQGTLENPLDQEQIFEIVRIATEVGSDSEVSVTLPTTFDEFYAEIQEERQKLEEELVRFTSSTSEASSSRLNATQELQENVLPPRNGNEFHLLALPFQYAASFD